jgi:hypothetical protein
MKCRKYFCFEDFSVAAVKSFCIHAAQNVRNKMWFLLKIAAFNLNIHILMRLMKVC